MGKTEKFMVIDGNSLAHRAFYALPVLTTTKGVFTNAAYGFTNMLLKVIQDQKPDFLAVAFDKGKITFRHDFYTEYKGTRKPTPDELRPQFPLIKEIVQAMNIPFFEKEGFEADDLIGTLTALAEEKGLDCLIVTGDKDALQLISPKTKALLTKKGITELEVYDEAKLQEKYGVTPTQFIDLKGLMGDSSDNIPGIPGVGEKTAIKLLQEFGCVEELIDHTEKLTGKLKEKVETNRELAILSKRLATIIRDVPMDIDLVTCCRLAEPDYERMLTLFKELEFRGLIKQILDKINSRQEQMDLFSTAVVNSNTGDYTRIDDAKALDGLKETLEKATEIAVAYEVTLNQPMMSEIKGLAFAVKEGEAFYLPTAEGFFDDNQFDFIRNLFTDPGKKLFIHDAKRFLVILSKYGLKLTNIAYDTMVAAYLVNPALPNQKIEDISLKYLDKGFVESDEYTSLCAKSDIIFQLSGVLTELLKKESLTNLFYEVELPLVSVLAQMEINGISVDGEQLAEMSHKLGDSIDLLTKDIYAMAGEDFNVNSTKQLAHILFEKLQLPVIKKTKTGYSTDAEVLETLAEEHQVVAKILEYRQLVKLKSTYADGLANLINPKTGRLHTTFNQTVTATGRLSSTEPNLQNIPIRLEEGRKIRKVFTPQKGHVLLTADYSQIELRILAHISEDAKFIEAFQNNEDIHTRTASEVFGTPLSEVTSDMRRKAKAVNFGIVYGISDFGLAKDIKVSRQEAKDYIASYFARYPGVKSYLDNIIADAHEKGYVTTILNRRRYLPDIHSKNYTIRSFGERTAMNTPIQGSAADIIKMAMLKVNQTLKSSGLLTKMLLQVHDELIFEVPLAELDLVKDLVIQCMEKAVELKVPLIVDVKTGQNWYDMVKA